MLARLRQEQEQLPDPCGPFEFLFDLLIVFLYEFLFRILFVFPYEFLYKFPCEFLFEALKACFVILCNRLECSPRCEPHSHTGYGAA